MGAPFRKSVAAQGAFLGACIARITSWLRSLFLHASQFMAPARLSASRFTALGAAQMGQTNGTRTGALAATMADIHL